MKMSLRLGLNSVFESLFRSVFISVSRILACFVRDLRLSSSSNLYLPWCSSIIFFDILSFERYAKKENTTLSNITEDIVLWQFVIVYLCFF